MEQWTRRRRQQILILLFVVLHTTGVVGGGGNGCATDGHMSRLDRELVAYVDKIFSVDSVSVMPGVGIERVVQDNATRSVGDRHDDDAPSDKSTAPTANPTGADVTNPLNCNITRRRRVAGVEDYFYEKWNDFSEQHVVALNLPQTARFLQSTGKSSFLAGFGMGFLAFALKKLLLPVFIGAQLVKSVLIAMFLPSLLGSLGKIVGKGLSTFSGVSGSSAGLGGGAQQPMEDFEFKDTGAYNNNNEAAESSLSLNVATSSESPQEAMNRFGYGNNRISDNYYLRQPNKKTDFKVFHKIPASSLLLTTYDPFYSPLLSRLDAVFQQLGLGDTQARDVEKCRERLVCMMYANPAKYAPYSNLISAQLSRELNELRKPSSDNPEILRFFKYMKAAKDGQDGEECLAHTGCSSLQRVQASPAMLTTFNDINKLVQARKLH